MKLPKLTKMLLVPLLFSLSLLPVVTTFSSDAYAASSICDNANVPDDIKTSSGCNNGTALPKLTDVIQSILNGVIGVLGLVAVIFIVVGGINYMTSTGDTQKTIKARNTILYALIGLAIAALAFIIVNFVINDIIGGGGGGGTGPGIETVGDGNSQLPTYVRSILNGIISVLGLACVVVMIIGGVNYMTSTGDTNKIEKGKKTLLYGFIGLVICVLAFAIVNFLIVNIIGGKSGGGGSGDEDEEAAGIIIHLLDP